MEGRLRCWQAVISTEIARSSARLLPANVVERPGFRSPIHRGASAIIRTSQRNGDSWKSAPPRRLPQGSCLGLNAHQRLQAVDFGSSDPNSPLSARPSLKIVDRHPLASNHEQSAVGLSQPVVERCSRDRQLLGGLLHREQSMACLSSDHAPNLRAAEAHQGRTVRTTFVWRAGGGPLW